MMYVLSESFFLVLIVYSVFVFFFYSKEMIMEVMSSYECGFDMGFYTRMGFSYRFFLIAILFIIFDVEVSLMLPLPFLMMSCEGMVILLIFLLILIFGLMYEYYYGSLDWLECMIEN